LDCMGVRLNARWIATLVLGVDEDTELSSLEVASSDKSPQSLNELMSASHASVKHLHEHASHVV
jgi:hypothetical protein